MKREDRMFLEGLGGCRVIAVRGLDAVGVVFRRTMASLATVNVVLAGQNIVPVAGHVVLHRFAFVAVAAAVRASKLAGGRAESLRPAGDRRPLRGLRVSLSEARGCGAT